MQSAGLCSVSASKPLATRASSQIIFFFQAEDGIRDVAVTGVQTCALPISVMSERRRTLHGWQANANAAWIASSWPAASAAVVCRTALRKSMEGQPLNAAGGVRSEERRVGEEGRSRWAPCH